MKLLFRGFLVIALFVTRTWAVDLSTNFVDYTVQVNGHAARMVFVSSLGSSFMLEDGATRLGFAGDPFSTSTEIEAGGKKISVPIYILGDPIKKVPWTLRQAVKITHPFLYHQFMHIYQQVTKSIEGVVGWPEIRNNILVFDSDRRVIRRVEELPPETSGWIKLRILPFDSLMLEVPLSGEKKGVIYIDTGDNRSVMLAPRQWKAWRQAHPSAPMLSRSVWGLPLVIGTDHEAFAGKVEIGPMVLTDTAIEDMDGEAASRLLEDTPWDSAVWTLGAGALSRIDLVLDGKNGWAYVHPKAPLTTPPPAIKKNPKKGERLFSAGPWKVADNVQMAADGFFLREGEHKWRHEDVKGALADFDRALEINPRNARASAARGVIMECEGNFVEAVSNYDKTIELRPQVSQWERLYRETLMWRVMQPHLAQTNLVAKTNAASGTAVNLDTVDVVAALPEGIPGVEYGWPKTLAQFIVGRIDEKALLAAAKQSDDAAGNRALAYYYIGMWHLSLGERSAARTWFQKCKDAEQKDDEEYYFAVSELKRLSETSLNK